MGDFRPISLCNVIYKVVAKVLANRLKRILPNVISPTQSAFVPRRLITGNILITYETLHSLSNRCYGQDKFMAILLDMSKAYDRVEWEFLEKVLQKIGFHTRWINPIGWTLVCKVHI